MFWQILKQLFPSVSVPSKKYSPPLQGIIVNYSLFEQQHFIPVLTIPGIGEFSLQDLQDLDFFFLKMLTNIKN